jgi:hypothetical protein
VLFPSPNGGEQEDEVLLRKEEFLIPVMTPPQCSKKYESTSDPIAIG